MKPGVRLFLGNLWVLRKPSDNFRLILGVYIRSSYILRKNLDRRKKGIEKASLQKFGALRVTLETIG